MDRVKKWLVDFNAGRTKLVSYFFSIENCVKFHKLKHIKVKVFFSKKIKVFTTGQYKRQYLTDLLTKSKAKIIINNKDKIVEVRSGA